MINLFSQASVELTIECLIYIGRYRNGGLGYIIGSIILAILSDCFPNKTELPSTEDDRMAESPSYDSLTHSPWGAGIQKRLVKI